MSETYEIRAMRILVSEAEKAVTAMEAEGWLEGVGCTLTSLRSAAADAKVRLPYLVQATAASAALLADRDAEIARLRKRLAVTEAVKGVPACRVMEEWELRKPGNP